MKVFRLDKIRKGEAMAIDLSSIKHALRNHMQEQPYKITCSGCGEALAYDIEIDSTFDLILKVSPCKCQGKED